MAPDDVREVFVKGLSIWTAEEDAHLRALGGFGELTDLLQSSALLGIKGWSYKNARTSQLRHGSSEVPSGLTRMKVYTSVQEAMAQFAHTKDAALHDPIGHALLQTAAEDEARHSRWFKAEVKALMPEFSIDVIRELHHVAHHFEMPGSDGIPDYKKLSAFISAANLLTTADLGSVLSGVVKLWGINDIPDHELTDDAKRQRDELASLNNLLLSLEESRAKPGRFVLGQTVSVADLRTARAEYAVRLRAA